MTNHNKGVLSQLKGEDKEDKIKNKDFKEENQIIIDKVVENKYRYIKVIGNRSLIDTNLILHDFSISQVRAKLIKSVVESIVFT